MCKTQLTNIPCFELYLGREAGPPYLTVLVLAWVLARWANPSPGWGGWPQGIRCSMARFPLDKGILSTGLATKAGEVRNWNFRMIHHESLSMWNKKQKHLKLIIFVITYHQNRFNFGHTNAVNTLPIWKLRMPKIQSWLDKWFDKCKKKSDIVWIWGCNISICALMLN